MSQQIASAQGKHYSPVISTLLTKFRNKDTPAELSAAVTITFYKVGKVVTCRIPTWSLTVGAGSATRLESEQDIPKDMKAVSVRIPVFVKDNGGDQVNPGFLEMGTSGADKIELHKNATSTSFVPGIGELRSSTFSYVADAL